MMTRPIIPAIIFSLLLSSGCSLEPVKRVIHSEKAPAAVGPYSQGIRTGGTLYLSGQIAIDPETGIMDTISIQSEVNRIMKNIGEVLSSEGFDYSDIVKTTIYTVDLGNYSAINDLYAAYLTEPYPARETVQVAALPKKAHVEISVIAIK